MEDRELPPLPEPDWPKLPAPDMPSGFSDTLMYAFASACAKAAVMAERERCAKVAENEESSLGRDYSAGYDSACSFIAAAIRKG